MYVLTCDHPVPHQEVERVASVWEKMLRGTERAWRTIVLTNGWRVEAVNEYAAGWRCWYCGSMNAVTTTRCNSCNANVRLA